MRKTSRLGQTQLGSKSDGSGRYAVLTALALAMEAFPDLLPMELLTRRRSWFWLLRATSFLPDKACRSRRMRCPPWLRRVGQPRPKPKQRKRLYADHTARRAANVG